MEEADRVLGSRWQNMGTGTSSRFSSAAASLRHYVGETFSHRILGELEGEELQKVSWLSGTLFFIVG